jgi:hypothetical protein
VVGTGAGAGGAWAGGVSVGDVWEVGVDEVI